MILRRRFTMYNLSYTSRAKNKQKNRIIPCRATLKTYPKLKRRFATCFKKKKKRESGPTLSTNNFHFPRRKRQSELTWNPSTYTLTFVDIS